MSIYLFGNKITVKYLVYSIQMFIKNLEIQFISFNTVCTTDKWQINSFIKCIFRSKKNKVRSFNHSLLCLIKSILIYYIIVEGGANNHKQTIYY